MNLLLVRHGPAVDRRAWGARGREDRLRPLTAEGRDRTREAAAGLARVVDPPDVVAASPYTRAVETLEIVTDAFGVEDPAGRGLEELPALEPGAEPADLLPWLEEHSGKGLLMVVGHEPGLGLLAGWLLTGAGRPFLQIKKGGACLLDLGDEPRAGEARLLWLLSPSQLRRLGRGSR